MTRNISEILRGGSCTRWHANPDMAHIRETLAEHHAKVAQILLALHPQPTLELIDAALHHDCGEPYVGDVMGPAKREFPRLAEAVEAAERIALTRLGLRFDLSQEDRAWLKLADRMAAIDHVRRTNPALLKRDGWPEMIWEVREDANKLGADFWAVMHGID